MQEKPQENPYQFVEDALMYEGGRVSDHLICVRANNPSPMTYTGTNTYVIAAKLPAQHTDAAVPAGGAVSATTAPAPTGAMPVSTAPASATTAVAPTARIGTRKQDAILPALCYVVDPGPGGQHIYDVLAALAQYNLTPSAIIETHDHFDHTEGTPELKEACERLRQAPVPVLSRCTNTLPDGKLCVEPGAPVVEIISLPGHSRDSVGIAIPEDKVALTGDVVFKHGPTVVYYPDGVLADYLASLDTLDELVASGCATMFAPAHGWPYDEPHRFIEATRAHRLERLEQIDKALADGVEPDATALVNAVYTDIDVRLRPYAKKSVQAQLVYRGYEVAE